MDKHRKTIPAAWTATPRRPGMRPVPCTHSPIVPPPIRHLASSRQLHASPPSSPRGVALCSCSGWLARSLMFCPPRTGEERRESAKNRERGRERDRRRKRMDEERRRCTAETEEGKHGRRGWKRERGRAHFVFPTCCSVQTSCIACSPIRATVTLEREWD